MKLSSINLKVKNGEPTLVKDSSYYGKKMARDSKSKTFKTSKTQKTKSVPTKANQVVNNAAQKNGATHPGYKGGRKYSNDGRENSKLLPKKNSDGPIIYKEYDVNPYQKGVNRGPERVVIGSDGKSYYTAVSL